MTDRQTDRQTDRRHKPVCENEDVRAIWNQGLHIERTNGKTARYNKSNK